MDLNGYLARKSQLQNERPQQRERCLRCRQPQFSCYCKHVITFKCSIQFVILIHHLEFRRRIATGRIAHLCLENSILLRGYDYSGDTRLNQILSDPKNHCVILYPGSQAINLTELETEERFAICPPQKQLVIVVIDGTWNTAKKMLNRSRNLHSLPRVCFTPQNPSRFRVRKQPRDYCYSSVEAIHHTIDLFSGNAGGSRPHDNLLFVFDQMVEQQLSFIEHSRGSRHKMSLPQNAKGTQR